MEIRGGIELPVAFCSPEDGKFLSAPHTYKDCTITLSSHRGNDEVFTLKSAKSDPFGHLVHIRTSQRLYLALGSGVWLIKHEVRLQRQKNLVANLREKQIEANETLLIHAEKESIARGRVAQLEAAVSDLQTKAIGNTGDIEREKQIRANSLETLQKQLAAATNDYDRVSTPWRDAVRQNNDCQRQIEDVEFLMQQKLAFGCDCLDIERDLGAFLKPSEWRILTSDCGMLSIYSPELQAFLKTDLSFYILDGPFDESLGRVPPKCSWLTLPVPLHCRPGNVEATFSATKLLCYGRESFVFACAQNPMYELSVIKSLVRPDAARRIEDLMYEANMPAAPDCSDVLCPVLFSSYSTMPAMFYTQRRCGRNLVEICQQEMQAAGSSTATEQICLSVPLETAIRISLRICKIAQFIHNLGFLILDIAPSNFCESIPGDPLSLLITDFREVRRFQRMTYSTPNYMKTTTGGRLGMPTGEWKMMPFSSAFLDHLECNSLFASSEILKLPGSIDPSADVFSIASILVWMILGVAPSNIVNKSKEFVGESTLQARNVVLQNLKTVFDPRPAEGSAETNNSLGASAITSALDAPQLAELVISALSEAPESRPTLSILTAAFELWLSPSPTCTATSESE